MKNKVAIILLLIMIALTMAACNDESEAGAGDTNWEPGNAEIIVPTEPGGGSDTISRMMASILTEENIVEHEINVDNRPGGNGGVGMSELYSQDGSGEHLIAVNSSFITAPLQGDLNFTYEDFTPIANMGDQSYVLVVSKDSGIETFEEYVQAVEEEDLTFGSYAIGSSDHMVSLLFDEAIGHTTQYVPFDGISEAFTALLGGHVDVTAQQIGSTLEYIENGDVVPIAVTSPERVDVLEDVPTMNELGYDLEWSLYRAIYGPPNMPEEAQEYWINAFEELSENPRWVEEYQEPQLLEPRFISGQELEDYFDEVSEIFENNLREQGIIE
ncbi:tripartite tricarboxylate transporter substrate binding protein [Oceanobacillus jeddahense]|uniref:tripartite tricarboxylate transporter substrate binding protein n=1 Tax=Oceanobacillus jeddahense TaxID=1462527 RepID=UPI000595E5B3|nr:tripartite tricarboxylate transporter substrate binding protein [Oceanobacillus jeddahense]